MKYFIYYFTKPVPTKTSTTQKRTTSTSKYFLVTKFVYYSKKYILMYAHMTTKWQLLIKQ